MQIYSSLSHSVAQRLDNRKDFKNGRAMFLARLYSILGRPINPECTNCSTKWPSLVKTAPKAVKSTTLNSLACSFSCPNIVLYPWQSRAELHTSKPGANYEASCTMYINIKACIPLAFCSNISHYEALFSQIELEWVTYIYRIASTGDYIQHPLSIWPSRHDVAGRYTGKCFTGI
jgi:hypothetical protein